MIKRILAVLALAAGPAMAEVDLSFTDMKRHRQVDFDSTDYQGGLVFVRMQDGTIFIAGCGGQPSAAIINPNLFCPLGTTGFIAQGDVGNNETGAPIPDGIPDDGSFWSVSSIVPAVLVEPFQLDRVRMPAAPFGGISKALQNSNGDIQSIFDLTDASAVVWYNFLDFPVEEFEVTLIEMLRLYGAVPTTNQWVNLVGETITGDELPDPLTVLPNPAADAPVGPPAFGELHAVDIAVGDPLLREGTIYSGSSPFDFPITTPEEVREDAIPAYREEELERHYFDIRWGTYQFSFPALNEDYRSEIFGVTLLVSPDIYPGRAHVPQGWRMINEDWYMEALEVDPRVFYEFEWFGIDTTNAVPTADSLYLSMRSNQWVDLDLLTHRSLDFPDMADVLPNPAAPDPMNAVDIADDAPLFREDTIVFPPFPAQTPDADREPFLIGLFDGSYELGPFFFRPGDSAIGELDFRRDLEGGNATRDTSRRFLEFEISFIDTFAGFAFFSAPLIEGGFPLGTRTSERTPNGDYDGDLATNLEEYAFMTDVADASDTPMIAFDMVGDGSPGTCTASVMKRPNVGSSLSYEFEVSPNGLTGWDSIEAGDPDWDVVEDEEILMVTNTTDLGGSCYLRVRVSM